MGKLVSSVVDQPVSQGVKTPFNGVLLKRERADGRNLVRLLFRKDDQNVLCVSTNMKDATLRTGRSYKVEGAMTERGGRLFIENPCISSVKKSRLSFRQWAAASAALALFATGGTALAMHIEHYSVPAAEPLPTAKHVSVASNYKPDAASSVTTTNTPATTATTTTTKPAATSQQPTTAQTPDPNACTEQDLPYTPIHEYSATVPAGTDIQAGANGSENVCPDGSITNVTLPVAERISDGPAPAPVDTVTTPDTTSQPTGTTN